MDDLASLLTALAALAWPAVVFWALREFRQEIHEILPRIRKGKLLGQEVELSTQVKELHAKVIEAAATSVAVAPEPVRIIRPASEPPADVVGIVLAEAARDPIVALLRLDDEIRKSALEIMAVQGMLGGRRNVPLEQALSEIQNWGALPHNVPSSVRLFRDVRNRLVHGSGAKAADIRSALDSGITILRTLQAIPRETHVVADPDVPIFSDQKLTKRITGARGLLLLNTSPGGAATYKSIYPTTRTDYRIGEPVGWEWNDAKVFDQAWYRNPDTAAVAEAWTKSMEFVGRHLRDLTEE